MSEKKVFVIHGPNLNLLGRREVNIYGSKTLAEINKRITEEASRLDLLVSVFQSNSESEIIELFHWAMRDEIKAIVINPAAFTHTSVAIRDAISAVSIKTIEVHLSNIHSRESFRQESLIAPVCEGQISGLGHLGYVLALQYIAHNQ